MDIWATISSGQQHWSRLWEFADVGPATANELYFAPAWNAGHPVQSSSAMAFRLAGPISERDQRWLTKPST